MVPSSDTRILRFGTVECDAANGMLHRNGLRVRLSDLPFRLLMILLERPGGLVTRPELAARLWPGQARSDLTERLNAAMRKLRLALGDSADRPVYIETVPKRGYRFLAPVHAASPAAAAAPNPAATESYLKALYCLNRHERAAVARAIEELRRSVQLAPEDASAHANLALAYFQLGYLTSTFPTCLPSARTAAERALALDSTLARAHTVLALIASCAYDWRECALQHQLAVGGAGTDAVAQQMYGGGFLIAMGRVAEANRAIELARRLDPASRSIATTAAVVQFLQGKCEAALAGLGEVIALAPEFAEAYLWRASVLLETGRFQEATADLQRLLRRTSSPRALATAAYGFGLAGQTQQSERLEALMLHRYRPSAWCRAMIELGRGSLDRALDLLHQAVGEQSFELIALNVLPAYAPLRALPRFHQLTRRIRLPRLNLPLTAGRPDGMPRSGTVRADGTPRPGLVRPPLPS